MSGNVALWLTLVGYTALLVLAVRQLPKLWMHSARVAVWENVPAWWPLGDAMWRGLIRSAVVASGFGVVSDVFFLYILMRSANAREASLNDREMLLTVALTLLLGALFGAMATIILFNRPRSAVPPHLRAQPGAVTEWSAATRRWEARVAGAPAPLKPFLFLIFVLTGETVGGRRGRRDPER